MTPPVLTVSPEDSITVVLVVVSALGGEGRVGEREGGRKGGREGERNKQQKINVLTTSQHTSSSI